MKTYHAVASRGESIWLIQVPEIDQWTQAHNFAEVIPMTRDLIALWLDAPPDSFNVGMVVELPSEVPEHLDRAVCTATRPHTPRPRPPVNTAPPPKHSRHTA